MKRTILGAAAFAAAAAASPAHATVYTSSHSVGGGSVDLSFTTDDTIGALSVANFIDWSVTFDDGFTVTTLDTSNSLLIGPDFSGVDLGLTATASDLWFDFDAATLFAVVEDPAVIPFWCVDGATTPFSCTGSDIGGEHILTAAAQHSTTYSGMVSIASAIPEASTWAMMILGLGFAGGALRRRKDYDLNISYA